jgi:hypothetical protein
MAAGDQSGKIGQIAGDPLELEQRIPYSWHAMYGYFMRQTMVMSTQKLSDQQPISERPVPGGRGLVGERASLPRRAQ